MQCSNPRLSEFRRHGWKAVVTNWLFQLLIPELQNHGWTQMDTDGIIEKPGRNPVKQSASIRVPQARMEGGCYELVVSTTNSRTSKPRMDTDGHGWDNRK